jgi:hypothetical protein
MIQNSKKVGRWEAKSSKIPLILPQLKELNRNVVVVFVED